MLVKPQLDKNIPTCDGNIRLFFYLANKNGMLAKAVTSQMEYLLN